MSYSMVDRRGLDGKLLSGAIINPSGKNGHRKGWIPYGIRAQMLAEKYTTGEIIDFARSERKLRELSLWDAQIIKHLANTIIGDNVLQERKEFLDRIEGRATNNVVIEEKPLGEISVMSRDDMMLDCAKKIAFIMSRGVKILDERAAATIDHAPTT